MSRLVIPYYTVVRDTREREDHGWFFKPTPHRSRPPKCMGTVVETLQTGDYSAKGYEDLLVIERKYGFRELWNNYLERERFENELDRMIEFKYRYILVESQVTRDILDFSPPQMKRGVPGKALMSWLISITMQRNIHMLFVGDAGRSIARQIIENVIRVEKNHYIDINKRNLQETWLSEL